MDRPYRPLGLGLGLLLQKLSNVRVNGRRRGGGSPSVDHISLTVNEELFKIPLDALESQQSSLLRLEEVVHGVLVRSIHVNLLENGESDTVVELAELSDLLISAGFLASKLVGGESNNLKALVVVLFVQCLQTLVLGGESTLGGDIDNEDNLALQLLKRKGLALLVGRGQVVKRSSFGH